MFDMARIRFSPSQVRAQHRVKTCSIISRYLDSKSREVTDDWFFGPPPIYTIDAVRDSKYVPHQCSCSIGWRVVCYKCLMRECRYCNRGNFPRTRFSCSRLSWLTSGKARPGLVPTFHRWEEKLLATFGAYTRPRLLAIVQESRLITSWDALL